MFVRRWMMDGEGRLATDMQWVVVMRDTVRSKMVDCFAPALRGLSYIW